MLKDRLLAGAIGGIVGTAFMTMAMRRLHANLPAEERYPLPPREITERTFPGSDEATLEKLSLASHMGFGAAAGSLMAASRVPGLFGGSAWGLGVWLVSYLGWVPALGFLRPATSHPARRNLLMVVVHLIWGSVAAVTAREMQEAQKTILAGSDLKDAEPARKPGTVAAAAGKDAGMS